MVVRYVNEEHLHSLILQENFHAQQGESCYYCEKAILCISSVYTCDSEYRDFILHKSCELPMKYMHSMHEQILTLVSTSIDYNICAVCHKSVSNAYSCQQECRFVICLKCAIPLSKEGSGHGTLQHWSHEHPLSLLQRYATFECDGCNKVASDFSYLCDECSFWIHKSCASLPQIKLFGSHHKHPLQIVNSLPQVYQKFTQFCKICRLEVEPSRWLYYCSNCRFFAHIHCALSRPRLSRHEDNQRLIHLPAPDELSMNSMMQRCIKDTMSLAVNTDVAPPYYIDLWAHEHPLSLKNKSALTGDDGLSPESERLITCRGCTKPISSSSEDADDVFYECNLCNFSLHRYCAQLPKEINHHCLGLLRGFYGSVFLCNSCHVYSYGFRMDRTRQPTEGVSLHVWCASLPEKIKHQAHHHLLEQILAGILEYFLDLDTKRICQACSCLIHSPYGFEPIYFGCPRCDFYIHRNCVLMPGTVTHRWDPHPLRLVLSLENDVEDHPHEFHCEFCSEEIDTNFWFYHCNVCDLSFHLGDCLIACSLDIKVRHFGDLSKEYGSPVTRATVKLLNE